MTQQIIDLDVISSSAVTAAGGMNPAESIGFSRDGSPWIVRSGTTVP